MKGDEKTTREIADFVLQHAKGSVLQILFAIDDAFPDAPYRDVLAALVRVRDAIRAD